MSDLGPQALLIFRSDTMFCITLDGDRNHNEAGVRKGGDGIYSCVPIQIGLLFFF